MKKKSLLVLMISAAMLLSACGGKKPSESSGQPESEPTSSESTPESPVEPSEPSEPSEPEESEPTSEPEVINHQDPFVTQIANPSTTREFNADFDVMIEDFSSATPTGTTTGVFNDPFLRVLVDSNDDGEPTSPDGAIYKMATGNYQIQDYEGIGFTMRMTGNKQLKYSNLALGLRGDDAYKVFPITLSEALDPDQEELPALTEEFQDVIISPQQSLDASLEYELAEGGTSGTKVLDKILGFHLYALDEECSAVIEIKEVFLYNAGEKTSLDTFNRAAVNKADPNVCWWRDSTGFIVRKGVTLNEGKTYTTKSLLEVEELEDYSYVAVTVLGDTTGVTVNGAAWSTFKDPAAASVSNAVNGAFYTLVIDPDESDIPFAENCVIASTTEVVISAIFMTNLQNEAPMTDYPIYDAENVSHFDRLGRTSSQIASTYETGNSSVDEGVLDDGLNFSISYHGAEFTNVSGGMINITGGDYDYVQVTEGTTAKVTGYKYLVLGLVATDLSNFRISMPSGSGAVYANEWLAAPGLPSVPEDPVHYGYKIGENHALYIIDLERSGLTAADSMDMYYTGTADLSVSAIFFANDYVEELNEEAVIDKMVDSNSVYEYVGNYVSHADERYVGLGIYTSNSDFNGDQIRLEGVNGAVWFHDGGYVDELGNNITAPVGSAYLVIDLVASGLKLEGTEQLIDVHASNVDSDYLVEVLVVRMSPMPKGYVVTENVIQTNIPATNEYYWGGSYVVPADIDYLYVETDATVEHQLRFEGVDGPKWIKDGKIIDMDGNVVVDGSQKFTIDLVASGLKTKNTAQEIHLHTTATDVAATVNVSTYAKYHRGVVFSQVFKSDADLAGYQYIGKVDYLGVGRYMSVRLASGNDTKTATLKSIRFGGVDGDKWIKDGVVYDIDGHVIDANTVIPAEGITIIIDLVASRLVTEGTPSEIHIHGGGFDGSEGIINVRAGMYFEIGSYAWAISVGVSSRDAA